MSTDWTACGMYTCMDKCYSYCTWMTLIGSSAAGRACWLFVAIISVPHPEAAPAESGNGLMLVFMMSCTCPIQLVVATRWQPAVDVDRWSLPLQLVTTRGRLGSLGTGHLRRPLRRVTVVLHVLLLGTEWATAKCQA